MNHSALIFIVTFPVCRWDEIWHFKSSGGVIKELKMTASWFLYEHSQQGGCDHCQKMAMDAQEICTRFLGMVSPKWHQENDGQTK